MNKIIGLNISKVIERSCDKHGIVYKSPFLKKNGKQVERDKLFLLDCYWDLTAKMGELKDIQSRYLKIPNLVSAIEKTVDLLEEGKHELLDEVSKLIRKQRRNK